MWSPNAKFVSFTTRGTGQAARQPLDLWVADSSSGVAKKVLERLNTVFDE
jgi:hypothetical protein